MLQVQLPDGKMIEYLHDPYGRRIAKAINGTITEKYLWKGLTKLLAVYDGANNLIMRFEYADDRMPVSLTSGGNTFYLTYDQVGSLRIVSDASGNVVKLIDYDSFGNIINDTNPSFTIPFAFAGGLHDSDTGLVRFGLRDYDPDIGRWTAKDPIGFGGSNTDLYGYCLNNPINRVDPMGLKSDAPCQNENKCNQSWAECYTKCIKTLVPFNAFKTFVYSNMIANMGFYLSGGVTEIIISGETVVIYEAPIVLTGAAGAAAAIIGDAGLVVSAATAGWVTGASYGCMISCRRNKCNY